ncbi:MAG TPA: tyrosine-type recombinase/integrase, partial [Myxococcaceae bacterium]|nr:tyrosine-type recombinase/integrase [Myxococcaceae bacterium]
LVEARERACKLRQLLFDGVDPLEQRKNERGMRAAEAAKVITFKDAAEQYLKENDSRWTSEKHRQQWRTSLEQYAYPVLGDLPVDAIDTVHVLAAIKPLWARAQETASRTRGRIEAILGWAGLHGYRTGDNPARWNQHLEHALPPASKNGNHHEALPYKSAPAFMAKLRADSSMTARCLELIMLTATRAGEATGALWSEVDLEAGVWTIPAGRIKAGVEHKIPLSPAAVALLKNMAAIRQNDYVFPGRNGKLHTNPLCRHAQRIAGAEITVHGLRSTFRDWAAECTNFPREVAEMALAHTISSAVEAAYRRGDLFEKRRRMMNAWAEYCERSASTGATVTKLRRA